MESKRTTEESTDRGVSPVIGVILMVAITVILAAVIAAFVLDIGPGQGTVTGSAEVVDIDIDEESDGEVTIDITSASDADGIVVINDEGEATDESTTANTGAEEEITLDGDTGQFGVYLINGDVSDGGTLDEAESSTQVDSFEVDE